MQSLEQGAGKRKVQDNSPAGTSAGADDADRSATKADLASELAEIEVQKGAQETSRS
jgi:hypothetical protein